MKRCRKKFRKNSSGQLLIVAALAIAILISSTTIYVYELSIQANNLEIYPINDSVLALKQSIKNTVVSSLANVSKGGEKTILTTNLNTLVQAFRSLHELGTCHLTSTTLDNSDYDSGIWLSWDSNSLGISSAYANFTLKVYGMKTKIAEEHTVNVTTTVKINGFYTKLGGEEKLVNLTCAVYNEGQPALAENVTLFYEDLGSWTLVDSSNNLSIINYGNGTYFLSFTVGTSSDVVQVSAHVYDLRDIFVKANTTCYEA